jgi:hypothetical protein
MKKISFLLIFLALMIGKSYFPHFAFAQDGGAITGEGVAYGEEEIFPISITFPPAGGNASGLITWEGYSHPNDDCVSSWQMRLTGHFAGGDGGEINGTLIFEGFDCTALDDDDEWVGSGTWTGHLHADGTGNGTLKFDAFPERFPWQITFSPEAFAAAMGPAITHEYIFTTYGIHIEDSFGHDQWHQKTWSDQELIWLNDVLKVIPSHMLDRMAVRRIVRNQVEIEDGVAHPNTMGLYEPCDRAVDPQCDGSSATIRIFDPALNPVDFPNDPERQFKATILHELVHALQYHKGKNETYQNVYSSPLVLNYKDATRQITDIEHPDFLGNNGWMWYGNTHGWRYTNDPGSQPATNYGGTNPLEDMAEAVMMYVYDPERLKNSSWQRYHFIRDEMFEGVEYENGQPKQ